MNTKKNKQTNKEIEEGRNGGRIEKRGKEGINGNRERKKGRSKELLQ